MIEVGYIIFCVWLAFNNAKRIKANKKINHFLNGSIHLAVAGACGYFINWLYIPVILLAVRIFFNSALNLFRDIGLFYTTSMPKSFQDKIEQKVFGNNGKIPFIIYLVFWLIANFFLWFTSLGG